MQIKLHLITDATKLVPMIANAEEQLLILNTERNGEVIDSLKGGRALDRKTKAIQDATSRRDTASILAASLPDGELKDHHRRDLLANASP